MKILFIILFLAIAIPVFASIKLNNKYYAPAEYAKRKQELIARVKTKNDTHFDDYDQFSDWIGIIIKECPHPTLTNITSENLIEKWNEALDKGC